ncbi:hypothetical protein A9P82_04985 [Arachidicoccus ginsenosidimutans]|nr:hypothetical protein A9P82_04985 [Arachidicoccus sp. BS20]
MKNAPAQNAQLYKKQKTGNTKQLKMVQKHETGTNIACNRALYMNKKALLTNNETNATCNKSLYIYNG